MQITDNASNQFTCPTFEASPYIILEKEIVKSTEKWQINLIDPFGNKTKTDFTFEQLKIEKDRI